MVVSCLYVLFEALSFGLCLHYLYGKKVKLDIITIFFLLAEVLWMQIVIFFQFNNKWSILIYLWIFIYCGIRFGFKPKEMFINSALSVIIVGLLQATVMLVLYLFANVNRIGMCESVVINALIFGVVWKGLEKCKLDKVAKILRNNDRIIFLTIITIVLAVTFFVAIFRHDKGLNPAYYMVLLVSLILLIVVAIDIGKHKLKNKEMEAELKLHELYEDSFRKLIEDICARQHEFDNHINTIYSQHHLYNTYEGLVNAQKQYCKDIIDINRYNKLLSKGNPIILGLLYTLILKAEEMGIDVVYKVSIGELKSNVPIYKVVELLGNLINNAIDAVSKDKMLNKIKVVMIENSYEVAINISNECEDIEYSDISKFFKKGYSEKGENRGYGLHNVKKICEEYNIVLETMLDDVEGQKWIQFVLVINKPL